MHVQKARSGSATDKPSNAGASASIAHKSWLTWASVFLVYPSFYLRVGSAKATAPSNAAITISEVLILN